MTMKSAIFTLIVATAVGGLALPGHAQDKLKAAGAPLAGDHKEMPRAGSPASRTALEPAIRSGEMARMGRPTVETGVAQPNAMTNSKAQDE
jgi:hypothetical protein